MNKTLRNFWLDVFLFLLLGFNITSVAVMQSQVEEGHPGMAWHVHAITGILMTLGCLVHIGLHWQWFRAVLTGKARGKIKLAMNSVVTIIMLLAGLSGHEALTSTAVSNFHSFTGSMALIGLFIHGIKHTRWMASTAKRLIIGGQSASGTNKSVPRYS